MQKPKKVYKLNPEKVAYWYFRLNGFLQIEDFYVHPQGNGPARTDVDLISVRFPYRQERLYEGPGHYPIDIMQDDFEGLSLSKDLIEIALVEITIGECKLNGPWTRPDDQNMHRVLSATGCFPTNYIDEAADALYNIGYYTFNNSMRVRLIAIGRETSSIIANKAHQIIWDDLLGFIWTRLKKYKKQKKETQHWDGVGRDLRINASKLSKDEFIAWGKISMNINNKE